LFKVETAFGVLQGKSPRRTCFYLELSSFKKLFSKNTNIIHVYFHSIFLEVLGCDIGIKMSGGFKISFLKVCSVDA
jgi:hypothetical protein